MRRFTDSSAKCNDVSRPIITPAKFLGRDALPPELEGCKLAVAGFCRFNELRDKLSVETLSERIFSHLGREHQFAARVNGRTILALECLYGGPMSATVMEELAHYGVERVIGYGYAGSLTRTVPVGQIVLANAALVSDGTSQAYLPQARAVYPNGEMARWFREGTDEVGMEIGEATVWTTDAIYRETPGKVAVWREAGAQVVNMDTAHFYAVAQVVGIVAVYACVVSDCVEGPVWDDGFARVKRAMGALQDSVSKVATRVAQER